MLFDGDKREAGSRGHALAQRPGAVTAHAQRIQKTAPPDADMSWKY